MESIYFKILGVSLVLTVSCGVKALTVSTELSCSLKSGNFKSQTISIPPSRQYDISDLESNLDYIVYLIDMQCKKGVELNQIFNYSASGSHTTEERVTDYSSSIALYVSSGLSVSCDSPGILLRFGQSSQSPLQALLCKNPVRAGPVVA